MQPTNSVIYDTLNYTLQAIRCCASYMYVLLNRLRSGINSEFNAINTRASRLWLEINFIQWIPLRSYNDTQFVAITLFVVTPVLLPSFRRSLLIVIGGKNKTVNIYTKMAVSPDICDL